MLFCGLFLDNGIWVSLWWGVSSCGSSSVSWLLLAAEATTAPDECRGLIVEKGLASLLVDRARTSLYDSSVAFINYLNELGVRDEGARCRNGVLQNFQILLAMEKHHGVEIWDNIIHAVWSLSTEEGNDPKRWENLEVLIALTIENVSA